MADDDAGVGGPGRGDADLGAPGQAGPRQARPGPGGAGLGSPGPEGTRTAAGWREVLTVAAVAVGVVLGAAILTSVLPTDAQRVIFHTPVLIAVLALGTGLVLWRIAARRPPEP